MPLFLPSSATQVAPKWMLDDFGQLVPCPDESENNVARLLRREPKKDVRPSMTRATSLRRIPLKAKDPNVDYGNEYAKPSKKEEFNPHGFVQGAAIASSVQRTESAVPFQLKRKSKPEVMPAFRVFDETTDTGGSGGSKRSAQAKAPQSRQMQSRLEGLMSMAENMRLNSGSYEEEQRLPLPTSSDNDGAILQMMLERLNTVLQVSEQQKFKHSPREVKPSSRGGPSKWVTRYVDYTSKYGLGFLMNDGR